MTDDQTTFASDYSDDDDNEVSAGPSKKASEIVKAALDELRAERLAEEGKAPRVRWIATAVKDEPSIRRLHYEMRISARQHRDIQLQRMGSLSRIAFAVDHVATQQKREPTLADADPFRIALSLVLPIEDVEAKLVQNLEYLARQHPLRKWVEEQKGLGLFTFATLIGEVGDLWKFPSHSALWKYAGQHVTPEGSAPRRTKGVSFITRKKLLEQGKDPMLATAYNPTVRVRCHLLGESIVRAGSGHYRTLYDEKKREYNLRPRVGPSECRFGQHHKTGTGATVKCGDKHSDNAARRYAVKRLLRDMWRAWRVEVPEPEWETVAA